ncbi:MAG: protein kinase, partial [Oscillospiraceae bacterium]|nr:protein kinase [Oscillospiraceae bacterium]
MEPDSLRMLTRLSSDHAVFLVQDEITGRLYVKKVLSVYNPSIYRRLMENPVKNVPAVHGVYREGENLTVIEEFIQGTTVRELLDRSGPFSQEQALDVAIALCDIVSELHSLEPPLIHRDIKPSNVMISADGVVKLLDLNAAREGVQAGEDTSLIGTVGYAAPEQYGFGS